MTRLGILTPISVCSGCSLGWPFDQFASGGAMCRLNHMACMLEPTDGRCVRSPCLAGRRVTQSDQPDYGREAFGDRRQYIEVWPLVWHGSAVLAEPVGSVRPDGCRPVGGGEGACAAHRSRRRIAWCPGSGCSDSRTAGSPYYAAIETPLSLPTRSRRSASFSSSKITCLASPSRTIRALSRIRSLPLLMVSADVVISSRLLD